VLDIYGDNLNVYKQCQQLQVASINVRQAISLRGAMLQSLGAFVEALHE